MSSEGCAFSSLLPFQLAYVWSVAQIRTFFDDLAKADLKTFGIDDPKVGMSFPLALSSMQALLKEKPKDNYLAKPIALYYRDTEYPVLTMWDMMAWIFSVACFAPADATTENFYFPLAACYAKMCCTLCGDWTGSNPLTQLKKIPKMVQVIWYTDSSIAGRPQVIMGATLGNSWKRSKVNRSEVNKTDTFSAENKQPAVVFTTVVDPNASLKEKLRQTRLAVLRKAGLGGSKGVDNQQDRIESQKYGHCAESLPFAYYAAARKSVENTETVIEAMGGFSVQVFRKTSETKCKAAKMEEARAIIPATYDEQYMKQNLRQPCRNCLRLLELPALEGLEAHLDVVRQWGPGFETKTIAAKREFQAISQARAARKKARKEDKAKAAEEKKPAVDQAMQQTEANHCRGRSASRGKDGGSEGSVSRDGGRGNTPARGPVNNNNDSDNNAYNASGAAPSPTLRRGRADSRAYPPAAPGPRSASQGRRKRRRQSL